MKYLLPINERSFELALSGTIIFVNPLSNSEVIEIYVEVLDDKDGELQLFKIYHAGNSVNGTHIGSSVTATDVFHIYRVDGFEKDG